MISSESFRVARILFIISFSSSISSFLLLPMMTEHPSNPTHSVSFFYYIFFYFPSNIRTLLSKASPLCVILFCGSEKSEQPKGNGLTLMASSFTQIHLTFFFLHLVTFFPSCFSKIDFKKQISFLICCAWVL